MRDQKPTRACVRVAAHTHRTRTHARAQMASSDPAPAAKYEAGRPPVRAYRGLDEALSMPKKLDEWYGATSMTSRSIVAYIQKRMDHITPGAAMDYGITSDADWQRMFDRVVVMLDHGEDAARQLHRQRVHDRALEGYVRVVTEMDAEANGERARA